MLTGLKMPSLVRKCVFYRPDVLESRDLMGLKFFKFLKSKN